ncbi:MAG: NAD-dependent succinate-semialdehyde dehydrogenase [Bacteroidota bacterium]
MTLENINPTTGKRINTFHFQTDTQVASAIEQAQQTYHAWRTTTFAERGHLLRQAASILRKQQATYAALITEEMGKPIREAKAEVEKCAWVCEYYAEHAEAFLANEPIETDASKSYITHRPLGIVLAIMPWNFPFWQVFRFAAPALMAGNVALLKHALNVPGCGVAIEELFSAAGFPKGAFTNILVETPKVQGIIEHSHIKAVTLTGSERAGKAVASQAGNAIKKTVLELGGSDAYLILEDADLELAVEACAKSRLLNAGQSCIGAKRFLVVEHIYDAFLKAFKAKLEVAKVGDPIRETTTIGPLARKDLRDTLHDQVTASIKQGAVCELGGFIPEREGAYYPPTILTNVQKGMPAYEEELFGPVAAVFKVRDEAEAIRIANDSSFGLGSAVFTQDIARGERIAANELEAGSSFVNGMVKSDPRLPFGGIGMSGYGRELSYYGIREFTNVKTVWVK